MRVENDGSDDEVGNFKRTGNRHVGVEEMNSFLVDGVIDIQEVFEPIADEKGKVSTNIRVLDYYSTFDNGFGNTLVEKKLSSKVGGESFKI